MHGSCYTDHSFFPTLFIGFVIDVFRFWQIKIIAIAYYLILTMGQPFQVQLLKIRVILIRMLTLELWKILRLLCFLGLSAIRWFEKPMKGGGIGLEVSYLSVILQEKQTDFIWEAQEDVEKLK